MLTMTKAEAKGKLEEAAKRLQEVEFNGPMAPGLDMYPDLREALRHLNIARTKLDAHTDNEGD